MDINGWTAACAIVVLLITSAVLYVKCLKLEHRFELHAESLGSLENRVLDNADNTRVLLNRIRSCESNIVSLNTQMFYRRQHTYDRNQIAHKGKPGVSEHREKRRNRRNYGE